jgi:hypothetical protein
MPVNFKRVDDDDHHHHHVCGVRLRLWTAATNRPIFHPPVDILAWRTMVEWNRQSHLLIRPSEVDVNPTRSHLVAKQEALAK